ncbi:Ig-like domain-containing protein [Xanthocytophaga flava]|uniref:Ig-like domain-containing protein n=1 Tax=Xanthocytophaga flava TaxID=3048013 RepID=UPI0028D75709|nr:Ig-like domain-containing protein [Xanthocytophaga flavus]MDJ1471773.1 Ig-like domain-containing protein [Xanthocytophaga flavus]
MTIASGAFSDLTGNVYGGNSSDAWSFTIDNTVPALITSSLSPTNNATKVAVNANLVFRLSEKTQKGTGNIVIRNGSTVVETIAVTASNVTITNDSIVTINPTSDFPSSGSISVSIGANTFEDLSGNKFAGFSSWSFQAADIIAPTLVANSYSPANGATNVAADANLVFRLSEKVQKGTGNIVIKQGSTVLETIAVTSALVTISNDSIVTINPVNNFPSSGSVSVEIAANTFEDVSGNKFAGNTTANWTFQIVDYINPTAISYDPADGTTGVMPTAKLRIVFSEKVKKGASGTIVLDKGSVSQGIPVTGNAVVVQDSIVTITPPLVLPVNTYVSVQITSGAFQDLAGNAYAGIPASDTTTWGFKTVSDTIPPTYTQLQPLDNATNVAANAKLVITFSEKINKESNGSILLVSSSGDSQTVPVNSSSVVISGTNSNIVTITPPKAFSSGATIYVLVVPGSFSDDAGNAFAGITDASKWNFKVADTQAPTLSDTNPSNGATNVTANTSLVMTFSEPIKKGTGNITVSQGTGNPTLTIDVTDSKVTITNNTVVITLPSALVSGATVSVQVPATAFADLSGNVFSGIASGAWKFTVADTQPPVLAANGLDPADNATNVARNKTLKITFSEKVQKGAGSIIISENGIPTSIAISNSNVTIADNVVSINYSAIKSGGFASGASVFVLVPYGAFADSTGNFFTGISNTTDWNFTIIDNTKPNYTQLSPANTATNVASSSNLVITFGEAVKAGTGTANKIKIYQVGTSNPIETISANTTSKVLITGNTVTILNNALPTSGVEIYVTIDAGAFTDNAGNAFDGISSATEWRFKVADGKAPAISTLNPTNGKGNVGVNDPLIIVFDEAIQKGTSGKILLFSSKNANQTVDISQVTLTNATTARIPHSSFLSNDTIYVLIFPGTFKDLAGNSFEGISNDQTWRFTTADIVAPEIASLSPITTASGVAVNTNLVITFNEAVKKSGTGSFSIYQTSNNTLLQTISVADTSLLQVNGSVVTAKLSANLPTAISVYVLIDNGAFTDLAGNAFAGIKDPGKWTFTTIDTNAPVITAYSPTLGATNQPTNTNLSFTFDKDIQIGSGNIRLKVTGITNDVVIPVSNSAVSVRSDKRIVDVILSSFFPNGIPSGATVSVTMDEGTFVDLANNNKFAGIGSGSPWKFTVNDVIPPTLNTFTPTDNSTNVSVNTTLKLTFSETVKAGTGKISIYQQNNSTPIVTLNASSGSGLPGNTITYTLPTLPSETSLYVLIDGKAFTDLANLPYAGISSTTVWNFTTGDITAPTVRTYSPTPGETNVGVNRELVLTFSEQVKKGTDGDITINNGGEIQRININNVIFGTTGIVTLNRSFSFKSGQKVYILIPEGLITDLSGNSYAGITSDTVWSFTVIDNEKPTIESLSPTIGSTNVAPATTLSITFSEPVKQNSGTITILPQGSITLPNAGIVFSDDKRTITIPHANFTAGTITVIIPAGAFTDLAGNAFDGINNWSFTVADVIAPTVQTTDPNKNETNVQPNVTILAAFSEAIKKNTGKITIAPAGGTTQSIDVTSSRVTIIGQNTISIQLPQNLPSGAKVTVTIPDGAFLDVENNRSVGYQWSFTVADVEAPVATLSPVNEEKNVSRNKLLTMTFSEDVVSGEDTISVYVNQVRKHIIPVSTLTPVGKIVTIPISGSWPSNADVYVLVPAGAFKDASGNKFAGITTSTGWHFTIEDYIFPTITDYSPQNPPDAPVNSSVTLTFNEAVKTGAGTIVLKPASGSSQTIDVTNTAKVKITGNTVTIDPDDFGSNSTIEVTIPAGAFTDLAGNALQNAKVWTFKVVDTDVPFVRVFSPEDDSTNVSVNALLKLTFSKPVKKNTGTIRVVVNGTAYPIPVNDAAVSISSDNKTVTINPFTSNLPSFPSEASVYVTMPAGVFVDLSSSANPYSGISSQTTWNFKIVDIIAPIVKTLSPDRQTTGIKIDEVISITFSESIRIGSATDTITITQSTGKVEKISVTDARVQISGAVMKISHTTLFDSEATVTVQVPASAVEDLSGNRLTSLIGWNFKAADIIRPTVDRLSPTPGQSGVATTAPLIMIFSERIKKGTGKIILTEVSNQQGNRTETMSVSNDSVQITTITVGNKTVSQVSILHKEFLSGATVSILMFDDVFTDLAGNTYGGLTTADSWKFSVSDVVLPYIANKTPEDEATRVASNTEMVINFSEAMKRGKGEINLFLKTTTGTTGRVINVTDTNLVRMKDGESTVIIRQSTAFPSNARVTVYIPDGAFTDLDGNAFGLKDTSAWNFTIVDYTNPIALTLDPLSTASDVGQDKILSITFDKPVKPNIGFVRIFRTGVADALYTINVKDATQVSINSSNPNQILINPGPNGLLPSGSTLYVTVDAASFVDFSGNEFLGIGVDTWKFTVRDVIPPRIVTYRPVSGTQNVAPDTPLELTFSETVKAIANKRIYVYVNGVVRDSVLATATQITNGTKVTIPVRSFNSEDKVYIRMPEGTFEDLVGNKYAGINDASTWNFTVADVNAPTATAFIPTPGSTYVKIDAVLSITFNEAIKKGAGIILLNEVSSTLSTTQTIAVDDPAVVIAANGRTVYITPPDGLPYKSNISVQIPSGTFMDLAGNAYKGVNSEAADKQWNFTTVPPPDNDPPLVSTLSPRDNAVDVPLNSQLIMSFNEPIFNNQQGTLTIGTQTLNFKDAGSYLKFSNNLQTGSYILTITPPAKLPPNTNVSVQISKGSIVDSVGNQFAGYVNDQEWNFLTADPSDTIAPIVQILDPDDGSSNVKVSQNMKIVFSERIRKGKGNIIINNNSVESVIPVSSSQITLNNNIVTINPDHDLAPGANVNVIVPSDAFTDLAGNQFVYKNKAGIPDPQDWNFSTLNSTVTTMPSVKQRIPDSGDTVSANTVRLTLIFDRKMKKYEGVIRVIVNSTVNTVDVEGSGVEVDASDSAKVYINFPSGFPVGATVKVIIPSSAFVDTNDNSFAGFSDSDPWTFYIEDKDPPTVNAYSPEVGAPKVAYNTNLIVTFNEPIKINESLKTTANVTIMQNDAALYRISFGSNQISVVNNMLIINPSGDLPKTSELISVLIDPNSITDLSGNPFAGITDKRIWYFTSSAFIDDIPPGLISLNALDPAPNVKGVSRTAILKATFTEPIQKGKGSVTLVVDGVSTVLDVSSSQITTADNQLIIKPSSAFEPLSKVYVLIGNGAITDRANNAYTGISDPTSWSFTIEQAPPVELTASEEELLVPDTVAAMEVQAQLSQRLPGISGKMYYRGITSADTTAWQTQDLTLQGLSFTGTITREMIDPDKIGLEYYFELTFDSTLNSNPSQTTILYAYHKFTKSGRLFSEGGALKAGSKTKEYDILSVPLELENTDISAVFRDDLGLYDIKKWRIFHYNTETMESQEYQNGLTQIEPGLGYWFLSRNQAGIDTLDTGPGTTVRRNRTNLFPIFLTRGWNQIGNPYRFDVSWDDVQSANSSLDTTVQLFTYDDGYLNSTVLPKYRGGFVFVDEDTRIVVPTTLNQAINSGRTSSEVKSAFTEGALWEINFAVKANDVSYNLAGLGMHERAAVGKDKLDRIALPRLPQYLDIRFEHPEYFAKYFTKDMVPVKENFIWEFTVGSGLGTQDATFSWTNKLPENTDKKWILFDVQQNKVIDLTSWTEYKFKLGKSALFRMYYGTAEYIQENLKPEFGSLGQIYPNPFHQTTTIPFALAESEQSYQVRMDIYTITGVKVTSLVNGTFDTGLHEVTWDGKGSDGNRVAAGMYICQMEVMSVTGKAVYRKKVIIQ